MYKLSKGKALESNFRAQRKIILRVWGKVSICVDENI